MSGNGYFISEAINLIKEDPDFKKSKYTPEIVSRLAYNSFKNLKNQKINEEICSKYGLTLDDVVRGYKNSENGEDKVDPEIMKSLQRNLSDNTERGPYKHLLNNGLVTVGFNGKTPEICSATPLNRERVASPYHSI